MLGTLLALTLAAAAAEPAPAPAARPAAPAASAPAPPPAPDAGAQKPAPPADPGARYELPAAAARALQAQLQKMNEAGVRGDYGALVDLMYPPTVAALGGRERAVAQLEEAAKGMAHEGARLAEARAGRIEACVKTARQLQCVVAGEQTLTITGGRVHGETETLAFSEDGGQRWTFLMGGQEPEATRATLPELSPLLPLRALPAPKFEPDPAAKP